MSKDRAIRQKGGHVIVTCGKCSSEGVNHATKLQRVSTAQNDATLAAHRARLRNIHVDHEGAWGAIVARSKTEKVDLAAESKRLGEKLQADIAATEAERPVDGAHMIVTECPWCQTPMNVRIEPAPVDG